MNPAHTNGMSTSTPLVERIARALALSGIPVRRETRIRAALPAHRATATTLAAAIADDELLRAEILRLIPSTELHREVVDRMVTEHPLNYDPLPNPLAAAW